MKITAQNDDFRPGQESCTAADPVRQAACTASFTPGRPGSCGGQSGPCAYSPPTCKVDHSFRKVRALAGAVRHP
jgi:hypothetical protein